jgi:hypothetical protein
MTSYILPSEWVTLLYSHSFLNVCSAVSETQFPGLGLTYRSHGTTNPSISLPTLLGQYVIFSNLSQPSLTLISQAWQCHNYFKWFPHRWAIEEFIKSSLKNRCAYACSQGYLQEYTNTEHAGSDEEDNKEDNEASDGELDGEVSASENGGDDNMEYE